MKQAKSKQQQGPGFRTADHFKGFTFSQERRKPPQPKFNPTTFYKTQHKG